MNEDATIEMGEYEILCNKEQTRWRLLDKLSGVEKVFDSLASVIDYIELEISAVEIDG